MTDAKPVPDDEGLPAPLVGKVLQKQRYKGGRNTELDALWLDYARMYLDTWEDEGKQIPTVPGLCLATGISEHTFYNWINKLSNSQHDCSEVESQFLQLAYNLRAIQHDKLVQGGLSGKLQPTITKLVLHKHGYSDKSETEVIAKGQGGMITADLDAHDAANIYLDLITGSNEEG